MTIQLGFYAQDTATALAQIGGKTAIVNSFHGFSTSNPFPAPLVNRCKAIPATPMVTWMPTTAPLADIAAGKYDGYITSWAASAKTAGVPLYVRFAHEMNGGWYPWGQPQNSPSTYVAAWQRVVGRVRAAGAPVQFVWCIASSRTDTSLITSLFPGDQYVDWVSMDGYNRNKNGKWRSCATIFSKGYDLITSLSAKPVLIAETASVEDPLDAGRKGAWITDTFLSAIPNTFPKIQAACYFDAGGTEQANYPWTSSTAALAAIQAVFKSPLYRVTP